MKYEINSISTPLGGLSWDKNITEKDRFKYLLLYLESKRILTNPSYMELKEECIQSVLEIKSSLVEITKDVSFSEKGTKIIRDLISACNDYLNTVGSRKIPHLIYKSGNSWADIAFDSAMKNFRSSFRSKIFDIENEYKLEYAKEIPQEY